VLNLNCLDSLANRSVTVAVRAIAKEDAASYQNGAEGTFRTVELPVRMDAPQTSSLGWSASAQTLSADAFEANAGTLTIAQSYDEYGNYEAVLEVTDADGNHLANLQDGTGCTVNSGNPLSFMGDLGSGELQVSGIPAKYAGQYLQVTIRAVGASSLSSVWTVCTQRFRLPKIQLSTPALQNGTFSESYTADGATAEFTQQAVSFDPVDFAGQYAIEIIHAPRALVSEGDEGYTELAVSYVTVKKEQTGYSVFCTNAESDTGGMAQALGTVVPGGEIMLPYSVVSGQGAALVTVAARLAVSAEGRITLVLPDYNKNPGATSDPTQSVVVRAAATDADDYTDSAQAVWYRTQIDSKASVSIKTVDSQIEMPAQSMFTLTTVDQTETSYQISAHEKDWIVLEIADDQRKKTARYSMPGREVSAQIASLLRLRREEWGASGGHSVTIRAQFVSEDQGVSGWIEFTVPLEVLQNS